MNNEIPNWLLEPETIGQCLASAGYRRSMKAAGRGRELRKSRPTPLKMQPVRRKPKRKKLAEFKKEWESLTPQQQRNNSGFETFKAKREFGLIDERGRPTGRNR